MSDPSNSASTPATAVDVQDPLPESDWFWRRVFTYAVTVVLLAGIAYVLQGLRDVQDSAHLYEIGMRLTMLVALLVTYYLVAPSAEQIVKLVQAARLIRAGVPFYRTASAETPEGGKTEVTTAAGSAVPTAPVADDMPEDADWGDKK